MEMSATAFVVAAAVACDASEPAPVAVAAAGVAVVDPVPAGTGCGAAASFAASTAPCHSCRHSSSHAGTNLQQHHTGQTITSHSEYSQQRALGQY